MGNYGRAATDRMLLVHNVIADSVEWLAPGCRKANNTPFEAPHTNRVNIRTEDMP